MGGCSFAARDNEMWNYEGKPKSDLAASRIRLLRSATYVAKLPTELFCLQYAASPSATYVAKTGRALYSLWCFDGGGRLYARDAAARQHRLPRQPLHIPRCRDPVLPGVAIVV